MAAFISVPRDLSKVKTKVFMNLTKRQLLCFGAGALIGVPLFFVLKSTGNISFAAMGMIKRPKVRPYKTNNYYAAVMRQYQAEKEVERIVCNREKDSGSHPQAVRKEKEGA